MPDPYAIFTSYACRDATGTKTRYFQKFVKTVRDLVDGKVVWDPPGKVCFVDQKGIKLGDVWDETLAEAIGSAQVLVCLVSPHYLNSEWCGRELRVFLERLDAQPPEEGRVPRIFPLIWELIPGRKLPRAISQFQFQDGEMPQAYRENGLRQVAFQGKYRTAFQTVVEVVSDCIRDAVRTQPRLATHAAVQAGWTKANWEALINCLENERQACEVEILSCIASDQPISNSTSLREIVTQLSDNLRIALHFKSVTADAIPGNLQRLETLDGIPVLLASLDVPQDVETILRTAANAESPIGVVLLDVKSLDASRSIVIPGLEHEIHFLEVKSRLVRCTPADLMKSLERLATHLRNERLNPLESARATSVEIEQRAAADGIPTAQRPDVIGPNGRGVQ